MTGTLINAGTVILGTTAGLVLKSRLPDRLLATVFQAIGLFTLALGVGMSLKMKSFLIVVFSLIVGTIVGELLRLEARMERMGDRLKARIRSDSAHFTEGMLTAFLLFCMGSLTILGALKEGTQGDSTLLITKAVMDGFASAALASVMGVGVGFSVIPLLLYQGGLTLFAGSLGQVMKGPVMESVTATGGILLIGLGINILEIKRLPIANMMPSLVFVVLFTLSNSRFALGL